MNATLTDRQRAFIDAYLAHRDDGGASYNATEAARLAGYAWPDKQGPRLLSFSHVKAEVDRRFRIHIDAIRAGRLARAREPFPARTRRRPPHRR